MGFNFFIFINPARHLTPENLCPRNNAPCADLVIGVTGEQGLAIGGPGERDTFRVTALLASIEEVRGELVNLALLLEIENDDTGSGGSAKPVTVGGEDKSVNLITGGERVEVLGLVKVPQHSGTVLSTGSTERSVRGDGDGVNVTSVAGVIGLDPAGSKFPNLKVRIQVSICASESGIAKPRDTKFVSGNKVIDCLICRRWRRLK
jgi:hypothetical protein